MDLGDPWMLASELLIGLIGLVTFNYGRKQADLVAMLTGAALCVYPYFVGSLWVLWVVFLVLAGGMVAWKRVN